MASGVPMRRMMVAMGALGVGCAGSPEAAACLSESTYLVNDVEVRQVTDYDAQGRLVRDHREASLEGAWFSTALEERVYVDGLLALESHRSEGASTYGEKQVVHRYRHGRRVETATMFRGDGSTIDTFQYDDDGQQIGAVIEGTPDQIVTYTWEAGRRVSVENVLASGEVVFQETREYLEPAPSLDAEVTVWSAFVGPSFRAERYDGELLIQRTSFDEEGAEDVDERWAYRGDGQVEMRWWDSGQGLSITEYAYDRDGHLVAERVGPDADGDDILDEVEWEQEWTWTCW